MEGDLGGNRTDPETNEAPSIRFQGTPDRTTFLIYTVG